MKKGYFFTLDALFATILIGMALILSSKYFISEIQQPQINYYSQDIVASLSNIKITEVNDSYIQSLISSGEIINLNNSVIEQIGEFYVLNKTELARNLSIIVSEKLIPDKFGFEILVNGESIYLNDSPTGKKDELVSSRRLISGIEKFKPLRGATSKVYLKGIRRKKYSSYLYFGGFVGQGNISGFIVLPSDINITGLYLELDAGSDFNLDINGVQCGGIYSAGTGTMTADAWDISSCDNSLAEGAKNNFSISFLGDLGEAFIGGGFIRVDYQTDVLQQEPLKYALKEWLPNIEGIINLYSSFYVPGTLNNISVYLHYFVNATNATNNTFYLTIGNSTVYKDSNLTGEKNHTVTVQNITKYIALSSMNAKTVPIRVGFENVSFGFIFEGNADVTLVTDVSGSMDWRMDSDNTGTARNCDDANFNDSSTARLSVAKCLDKQFSKDILNITGNQVGLISYDDTTHAFETVYPTTNFDILNQTIGTAVPETGYEGSGATCVCCGINSAVAILTENISKNTVIQSKEQWYYTTNYFLSPPPVDDDGDSWYHNNYDNESDWSYSDNAIYGSTNGFVYSPIVDTEIGSSLAGNTSYANLWEHNLDNPGPPNDFSSGILNYTANTFGSTGNNDGWDYDNNNDGSGPFGYDDDISYNEIVNGQLEFNTSVAGSNACTNFDCSGAYGIAINITSELYNVVVNGGKVKISFNYNWDGNDNNPFESTDEVWIKSYWWSPTSGTNYLGAELSSSGGDTTLEVDRRTNPDTDFSGTYSQEITSFIEGPGLYYLAIGGKLLASENTEWGTFRFDNIQLEFEELDPDAIYANLWENTGDITGPPNDFSSGVLNSTANTFGITGNDDGWDWDTLDNNGVFGFDDNIDYNQVVTVGPNKVLEMDNDITQNDCSNYDCSGAYGIEINITQEMYNLIQANGAAILSFNYEWDGNDNPFETSDQVWVKARWSSSTSSNYLGTDLDANDGGSDNDPEIFTMDNPDAEFSGTYSQDVSPWITGPGNYYLELGGKLRASESQEYGWWRFDNIELKITNKTNHYYFRKHFNVADLNQVGRGVLNVLYDDTAKVYLNGQLIYISPNPSFAQYWNARGIQVPREYFKQGDNVVAVDLSNTARAAKFDLELIILNDTREDAIMVMTDGVANRQCAQQGTGDAIQDAIQAACDARQEYGITVYAVGFSDNADETTLQGIADCGNGIYRKSDNITALQQFYQDVASTIISATRHSQTIEIEGSGDISESILYGDSNIDIEYDPLVDPPEFGEISIIVEEKNFPGCSFNVYIPGDVRVSNSKLTSYSSEHWTDALIVNNNSVYNLSDYSTDYTAMGDPFLVNIPVPTLQAGNNSFFIRTGDSPLNYTECSKNNTLIYTAQFTASVSYSDVLEKAIGCEWSIEFEDGENTTVDVPPTYTGTKQCYYTNASISYDANDTYDDAMYNLLDNLDFDDDGRIYVNIEEQNFVIGAISVGKIPYPWGPALAEVRVWR